MVVAGLRGLRSNAAFEGGAPKRIASSDLKAFGTRRLVIVGVLVALAFVLTTSSALAHGDVGLVNKRVTLEPGESREYTGDLHYHRLVGRISADGPVIARLVDNRTGDVVANHGPDMKMSFNELIRCCDDAGWAPHVLVLENVGNSSATVDITARLVHDDLAVMVYGAEGGTRESVAVFGVIWAAVVWRVTRRRKRTIPLTRSLAVTGGLISLVAAFSVLGLFRYGSGGPPALLAGLSDVSLMPFNPAVSGVSILIAILLFLWGLASVWWVRARSSSDRAQWAALGIVLSALVVTTGILVARTYGGVGIPIASALVALAPVLVVLWRGLTVTPSGLSLPDRRGREPGAQSTI